MAPHLLRLDLDGDAVDQDPVAVRRDLRDREPVGLAAVAQVHDAPGSGPGLGPPAPRVGVEARPVGRRLGVAELDRGLQQRHVGVAHRHDLAAQLQAVEPAGVDRALLHLGAIEQREQEPWLVVPPSTTTIVSPSARRRRASASSRSRPQAISLATMESNSAGITSPSATPVSTRTPGPVGSRSSAIRPGAGAKPSAGSSAFRRASTACPVAGGGSPSSRPPAATWSWSLTRSRPVTISVTGVLDLEPRVDLHEREAPLGRLVQELDGGRAAVARALHEPAGGVHDLALLLGAQRRARRLLDDLLVAALVGAVAQPDGPCGAVAVPDRLDLDVAGRADQPLHQHRVVAERLGGLRAGAGERGLQRGRVVDATDAAAPAARRRLDHQRVADRLGVPRGVLGGVDRPAAPGRDRHAGGLGEPLGLDLVADAAHHLGAGPDEDDAEPLAQLDEPRILGHEAPADPDGVGAGGDERPLERLVVEIADAGVGVERDDLVGVAQVHRLGLGRRGEGDHVDRLRAGGVELADGVDQPHRGLAPVDDGEASEGSLHAPQLASMAARIGASASSSTPPGSSIVR